MLRVNTVFHQTGCLSLRFVGTKRAAIAYARAETGKTCLRQGMARGAKVAVTGVRVSYSGQAYSPAGDKGRFVLPPRFRKAVKEASGDNRILCIDKHPKWKCLVGFGLSREEELHDQLEREYESADRHGRDFDYDERMSQLFGFEQVPFDDSGRFVMPTFLLGLADISDGLFFRGGGRFFTIWNPEQLYKMGPEWEAAQAACRVLVDEAGSKGRKK